MEKKNIINLRGRLRELVTNHPGKLTPSSEKRARDYLSRLVADEFTLANPTKVEPYIGEDGQIYYREIKDIMEGS